MGQGRETRPVQARLKGEREVGQRTWHGESRSGSRDVQLRGPSAPSRTKFVCWSPRVMRA